MTTAPEPASTAPASYAGGMADDRKTPPALVFDDPLARPSRDDTDAGWGGSGAEGAGESERDEAWYRRETPPHHGG
jgi:hypothetical protein